MSVLVTGSGGFVGKHLVSLLSARGYDVRGLERQAVPASFPVHVADITDAAAVAEVIADVRPDTIIHLAGQSSVALSWQQPERTEQVNAGGTRHLLQAVVDNGLKPRMLVVSSVEIYGSQARMPIREDAPLQPASPYARSRVAQEAFVREYRQKHGLPIVVARSFPHTGPGQQLPFVYPSFAKQVVDIERGAEPVIRVGDLEVKRDISDVRDVVRAYLLLVEHGEPDGAYHVCSGRRYSLRFVLDTLLSFSSKAKAARIVEDPGRMRKNDIPDMVGDNARIRALGWKPEIPIEHTLRDLLDYWRAQP